MVRVGSEADRVSELRYVAEPEDPAAPAVPARPAVLVVDEPFDVAVSVADDCAETAAAPSAPDRNATAQMRRPREKDSLERGLVFIVKT